MRLLLDTSIILEVILEQEKASEARALLGRTGKHEFFLTDFSVHSVGILLFRRSQHEAFGEFLDDIVANAAVSVVSVLMAEMDSVVRAARQFHLDFDDAYQYVAAAKYDLTIVSFDSDFDRTPRGRKTPAEVASLRA